MRNIDLSDFPKRIRNRAEQLAAEARDRGVPDDAFDQAVYDLRAEERDAILAGGFPEQVRFLLVEHRDAPDGGVGEIEEAIRRAYPRALFPPCSGRGQAAESRRLVAIMQRHPIPGDALYGLVTRAKMEQAGETVAGLFPLQIAYILRRATSMREGVRKVRQLMRAALEAEVTGWGRPRHIYQMRAAWRPAPPLETYDL